MSHRQQHKSSREGVKARELADLKRENRRLMLQVARLRKQLDRALKSNEDFSDSEEKEVSAAVEVVEEVVCCKQPGCEGVLVRLELGCRTLDVCQTCKTRLVVS